MLLVGGILLAGILGYLVYDRFSTSGSEALDNAVNPNRPALPKDYGQTLFSDPRFFELQPLVGTDLVAQVEAKTPSNTLPAPEKFQVFDMQSGNRLLFTWNKPADPKVEMATAIRITRAQGNNSENIAHLKPTATQCVYTEAQNLQQSIFLAYYIQEKLISSTPQIFGQSGQVGGAVQVSANVDGFVKLSWSNPADASVEKIEIYRSDKAGETGRLLASLEPSVVEYTDAGAKSGLYFYTLVWASEIVIGRSAQEPATATDSSAPAAPQGLTAKYNEELGGMELSWQPSSASDVIRYEVYRSDVKGQLGQKITQIEAAASAGLPKQALGYIDKGVAQDQVRYYSVIAVDAAGNNSTQQTLGTSGNANPFGEL
ncbi:hypothetical protein C4546_02560 [Candidatus Parcubacteria bacterium]|nr:MAG: hypothetical protein C4546_02560 [Candidatus Parcubacteria bacterium]